VNRGQNLLESGLDPAVIVRETGYERKVEAGAAERGRRIACLRRCVEVRIGDTDMTRGICPSDSVSLSS